MMRSADDRMTWVCTRQPPTARLRLAASPSSRAILDGGWWPGSRDPVVELCSLFIALIAQRGVVIDRIMLQPAPWDRHPRRIGVGAAIVRVGWFTTLDPALVIATGPRDLRIDLAVIPPETPYAAAVAAMLAASRAGNTRRAADILPTPPQPGSRRLTPHIDAEAVRETEGGHRDPDRQPHSAGPDLSGPAGPGRAARDPELRFEVPDPEGVTDCCPQRNAREATVAFSAAAASSAAISTLASLPAQRTR